jgi:hypothetical protein
MRDTRDIYLRRVAIKLWLRRVKEWAKEWWLVIAIWILVDYIDVPWLILIRVLLMLIWVLLLWLTQRCILRKIAIKMWIVLYAYISIMYGNVCIDRLMFVLKVWIVRILWFLCGDLQSCFNRNSLLGRIWWSRVIDGLHILHVDWLLLIRLFHDHLNDLIYTLIIKIGEIVLFGHLLRFNSLRLFVWVFLLVVR